MTTATASYNKLKISTLKREMDLDKVHAKWKDRKVEVTATLIEPDKLLSHNTGLLKTDQQGLATIYIRDTHRTIENNMMDEIRMVLNVRTADRESIDAAKTAAAKERQALTVRGTLREGWSPSTEQPYIEVDSIRLSSS